MAKFPIGNFLPGSLHEGSGPLRLARAVPAGHLFQSTIWVFTACTSLLLPPRVLGATRYFSTVERYSLVTPIRRYKSLIHSGRGALHLLVVYQRMLRQAWWSWPYQLNSVPKVQFQVQPRPWHGLLCRGIPLSSGAHSWNVSARSHGKRENYRSQRR